MTLFYLEAPDNSYRVVAESREDEFLLTWIQSDALIKWCIDQSVDIPPVIKAVDDAAFVNGITAYLVFETEHDAVLFKVSWDENAPSGGSL